MYLDLRRLDHFLAVVEYGSINRAARALNLSQAGMTKSIRTLEGQIDGQLFERGPSGSRLTRLGNTLLRHAKLLENQRARTLAAISAQNSGVSVELRIGVSMRWALRPIMSQVLIHFAKDPRRPRLTVVSNHQSWRMIEMLREGELDIVLGTPTEADDLTSINVRHFHRDPQRLVVRRGHPLTRCKKIGLADLEGYDWVRGPPETYFGRYLQGLYMAEGRPPPEPLLTLDSNALALDIVAQTDLVGIATQLMVAVEHAERIELLDTPGRLERATSIMTRIGDVLPDTATDVIDAISAALESAIPTDTDHP